MGLTIEEVRHMATLARVGMTDAEIERMRDQMESILENFDVLAQLDTESVEPTGHTVGIVSVMRADEASDSSPLEEMLANAPAREEDLIRVKAVLE